MHGHGLLGVGPPGVLRRIEPHDRIALLSGSSPSPLDLRGHGQGLARARAPPSRLALGAPAIHPKAQRRTRP